MIQKIVKINKPFILPVKLPSALSATRQANEFSHKVKDNILFLKTLAVYLLRRRSSDTDFLEALFSIFGFLSIPFVVCIEAKFLSKHRTRVPTSVKCVAFCLLGSIPNPLISSHYLQHRTGQFCRSFERDFYKTFLITYYGERVKMPNKNKRKTPQFMTFTSYIQIHLSVIL